MQSKATTVEQYLADLPADRREAVSAIRKVILKNLDRGFEEGMQYGMIGYYVPHRVYPAGYHCDPRQPVPFVNLASQKNHLSVYMMMLYGDSDHLRRFEQAWAKTGKKLNMGKCCVRCKRLEDMALDVIGDAIHGITAKQFIAHYEAALKAPSERGAAKTAAAKRPSATRLKKKSAPKAKRPAAKKTSQRANRA